MWVNGRGGWAVVNVHIHDVTFHVAQINSKDVKAGDAVNCMDGRHGRHYGLCTSGLYGLSKGLECIGNGLGHLGLN